jgi:hypothetical protein
VEYGVDELCFGAGLVREKKLADFPATTFCISWQNIDTSLENWKTWGDIRGGQLAAYCKHAMDVCDNGDKAG